MKHLLFYIVCFISFFKFLSAEAQVYQLPDNFTGEYTREQAEKYNNGEIKKFDFNQLLNITIELGQYFHDNYTIDDMMQKNFIEKLRPFFPEDTDEELQQKRHLIINLVEIYDQGKQYYDEYVSSRLAPKDIRLVNSYNDYDHPDEVKYVEAKPGHFIKVYNFKNFLTYSKDKSEREAIAKFLKMQSFGAYCVCYS